MAANNFKKYDDDFKKSLVSLFQMAKHRPNSVKSTAFLNPPLASGSSSILPFKSMTTVKSLLPNRLRNSKNGMPSSKKKTLS